MMLFQNESQVAATVKEARVICSQMALDIWTACSQLIFEARTGYLVVVKEAKTTRSHLLQEAEATCSKAICEAKAWKISQAAMLHKDAWQIHARPRGTSRGERRAGAVMTFSPLVRSSCTAVHHQLKRTLVALYHILLGANTSNHLHSSHHRGPPPWKNN